MDWPSDFTALFSTPLGRVLLQSVGTQMASVLAKAVGQSAGSLVADAHAGLAAARQLLDNFEASDPRVVQAVAEVRAACAGLILVPTEDQIFAMLNHAVDSLAAALVPALVPASATPLAAEVAP